MVKDLKFELQQLGDTMTILLDHQYFMIFYEFLYIYEIEWICYDKLRNRNDDSDSDNLKQEWVVEKYGDTIRFENKYYPGDNLMGNLEYKDDVAWGTDCPTHSSFSYGWTEFIHSVRRNHRQFVCT